MPAERGLIAPLAEPIVAREGFPLVHKPPASASAAVAEAPTHMAETAEIAAGSGFTTMVFIAVAVPQLFDVAYVIVAVPAEMPFTRPPATVAAAVLLLLQAPPGVTSASGILAPAHTAGAPVMGAAWGSGFTVTSFCEVAVPQLLVYVNVIVAVPAATPETMPEDTVATPASLLLHKPPGVASVKVVDALSHTTFAPATGAA
jgi:hypothetical protein